jgi:hypothetical protein
LKYQKKYLIAMQYRTFILKIIFADHFASNNMFTESPAFAVVKGPYCRLKRHPPFVHVNATNLFANKQAMDTNCQY